MNCGKSGPGRHSVAGIAVRPVGSSRSGERWIEESWITLMEPVDLSSLLSVSLSLSVSVSLSVCLYFLPELGKHKGEASLR